MNIVEQQHEILRIGNNPYRFLERCGRIAYKSEILIDEDSHDAFLRKLLSMNHESVFEHMPLLFVTEYDRNIEQIQEIQEETVGFRVTFLQDSTYILTSMNVRTLRDAKRRVNNELSNKLLARAKKEYNLLFNDLEPRESAYGVYLVPEEYTYTLPTKEKTKHIYRTVRFITDRGVTHEEVRHRCSFTQESTRYCNYLKRGMNYIKPVDFELTDEDLALLRMIEFHYNKRIADGLKPQQARYFLPNGLKTEIVHTANLRQWKHILDLRTNPASHPQIVELMKGVLASFKREFPSIFNGDDTQCPYAQIV